MDPIREAPEGESPWGSGGDGTGGGETAGLTEPVFREVLGAGLSFSTSVDQDMLDMPVHMRSYQYVQGNGAAVGDYDGDGDLDVYLLAHLGQPNRLFRNNLDQGQKTFTDVTAGSGLGDLGSSRVAHFVKLDGDEHLDLILLNDRATDPAVSRSRVFRNRGDGTFEDVSEASGFDPPEYQRLAMTLCDLDADGILDVFVSHWGGGFQQPPVFPGVARLYRGLGGFQFEDISEAANVTGMAHQGFASLCTDMTGDGLPELYVAQDRQKDVLLHRTDTGAFADIADDARVNVVGNGMGITGADVNNDGQLEIFVTNIGDGSRRNYFWQRTDDGIGLPKFEDRSLAVGVSNTHWAWGTEFLDVDYDGDLDLMTVNGFTDLDSDLMKKLYDKPNVLLIQNAEGRFVREGLSFEHPRDSRSLVAFDYDRDGDEDLLITNVNQEVQLYENVHADKGHWLGVRLDGPETNRSAIGARVFVETSDGIVRRQDLWAGESYMAGTPKELYFGFGEVDSIIRLEVHWPGGETQEVLSPTVDQMLSIQHPSHSAH